MYFLGIDAGATFIKGAILEPDIGVVRDSARVPFPAFVSGLPLSHREVDPEAILNAVRALIASLLTKAPRCEGILLTAQMHGVILADAEGRARSRYISWQDERALADDSRGGSVFARVESVFDPIARRDTGNELRPSLPICSLKALAEADALPQKVWVCSLVDFLIANLRHAIPMTDTTSASGHGVFDLSHAGWHRPIIDHLGLGDLHWPEIVAPGSLLGYAEISGRQLKIFSGIGDHQAALLGIALTNEELSLNVATGSQVSRIRDSLVLGDYQTRPFTAGRWINTVTHLPAGRALNPLLQLFAPGISSDQAWETVSRELFEVAETDLRVNLCFFDTSIGQRGAIENIHEGNLSRGHVFRAALECMASNYANAAARIWPERSWERLAFSGGLLNKLAPLQIILRRKLGGVFRSCESQEDTLEGLMRLARHSS